MTHSKNIYIYSITIISICFFVIWVESFPYTFPAVSHESPLAHPRERRILECAERQRKKSTTSGAGADGVLEAWLMSEVGCLLSLLYNL